MSRIMDTIEDVQIRLKKIELELTDNLPPARELSITKTKLEEASMWLQRWLESAIALGVEL